MKQWEWLKQSGLTICFLASVGCQLKESTCALCELEAVPDTALGIVQYQDVKWTALNPARGDKSPQAANLWGDRADDVATGFLVKFVDGFSSPPHIHNVTYRGVVIAGDIHNDDPDAAEMWMPAGSFWTQPAGEVHITSARAKTNIAYIEIDSGPYLVRPSEQSFDNGERPVNVHKDNLVWVDQPGGAAFAYLWGDPDDAKPYGLMVKLPDRFEGAIQTKDSLAPVVVVNGSMIVKNSSKSTPVKLKPGSYLPAGYASHTGKIETESGVILYVRATAPFAVVRH